MLDPHFVLVGALFSLAGSFRYAVEMVKGRTAPNRVTWLLWGLAPLIGFSAQVSDGVGLPAVLTLSVGIGPAGIFLASFGNRQARWVLSRLDVACGALAVLALVGWAASGNGTVALCFSIAADALAAAPTIVKAWRDPASEHSSVFGFSAINGAITLLTIDRWAFNVWAFPAYILVIAGGMWALVQLRLGPRLSARGRRRPAPPPPRPAPPPPG